jgi:hypothetical protein
VNLTTPPTLKKILRILITLNWATAIAAVIVFLATRQYLPTELTPYFESRRRLGATQFERVVVWIEIVLFFFSVADSVGLFLFRRWAKLLLIPLYTVATLLIPTDAVYIQTGWERMLFGISTLFGGMIIALVFFSPLAEVFDLKPDTERFAGSKKLGQ